ncbi:sulfotransferase family protein [Planctomicrobium sp. SH664]|uniref:sulfotransferase family protein n=1 Tax=Planctomicrobium sp. SH664 TaxID=3448125 RepID=UPI003F5BA9B0
MKNSAGKIKRSSQGQLTIWHGMTLGMMFRFLATVRPNLHWSRWLRIATLPPLGLYNSLMSWVEKLLYSRKIAETRLNRPPIFILGYWRSGTTLLHNLLTMDPRFTYPSLYETVFPNHCLTTQKMGIALTSWMVPDSRPMDNVAVSWTTPQEDDIALCILSLISCYVLVANPTDNVTWKKMYRLEGLTPAQQQAWEDALTLLMKKITIRDPKRIVLKSPAHTFHVEALLKLFPDAQFVHISRNPYSVFNSTLHLRETLIDENTLGKNDHPNPENDVIETMLEGYEAYERDRKLIPAGNLHEIRYEDLTADPVAEMKRLYNGLQLGEFEQLRAILEPQLPELKRYQKNKFTPDPVWIREVYSRCRVIYERFGYPAPTDDAEIVAA